MCRVRACRGWLGRGFRLVRDLPGDAAPVGAGAVGTLGTHGDVEAARAGGVQSFRKTVVPAVPALAVPLMVFPLESWMPRVFSSEAWSLSGRLVLVLSLTVYSSLNLAVIRPIVAR